MYPKVGDKFLVPIPKLNFSYEDSLVCDKLYFIAKTGPFYNADYWLQHFSKKRGCHFLGSLAIINP